MTFIRVIQGYRVGTGQIIQEGVYDASDPRLFEKADYLLANRFAEKFDGEPPTASEAAQDTNSETIIHSVGANMIRVFHGYRVSEGAFISAGVYDITDPALHGRGDYLLENRHAEKFEGSPAVEQEIQPVAPAPAPAATSYKSLTVAKLKELAAERGIDVPADALKDDIIKLLEAADEKE